MIVPALKRSPGLVQRNEQGVADMLEVPDAQGKNAYYIANLESEGFVVLSADRRVAPVLGFSASAELRAENTALPPALVSWLQSASNKATSIREEGGQQSELIADAWEPESMQAAVAPDGPVGPVGPVTEYDCDDASTWSRIGPLLTTRWGQRGGYNDLLVNLNCPGFDPQPPTGCVATAAAQVMNYYEWPETYNWDLMPDRSGSTETARLMRDIGALIGMDYQCTVSGAFTGDAAWHLDHTYGYANVAYRSYDVSTMFSEIRARRPVILRGAAPTQSCWLIFCVDDTENGHAWVADGVRTAPYCPDNPDYYDYFHMNWGWDGVHNAWFGFYHWKPGSFDFTANQRMVTLQSPR